MLIVVTVSPNDIYTDHDNAVESNIQHQQFSQPDVQHCWPSLPPAAVDFKVGLFVAWWHTAKDSE